ncbi:MAG: conjugal transfer protein TraF, partial [Acinetobacter sp.]|nr:conjugal transfer protein TraF [Acinetobacter sp.]
MKKFKMRTLITSMVASIALTSVHSQSVQRQAAIENQPETQNSANFYDRRSEGWYWYDDPEAKKREALKKEMLLKEAQAKAQKQMEQQSPPKVEVPSRTVNIYDPETKKYNEPIVVQASEPQMKPLSAEWLNANMPKMLNKALNNPYDKNGNPSSEMEAYMYAQRLALDMSQNFAKSATTLTQTDPFLDETVRVPVDDAANKVFNIALEKDKEEITKHLSQFTGIWFFYDSTCSFCVAQYNYLKDFKIKHNFKIMMISTDGKRLP